jgi:anti-sigma B factor antagonist
MPGYYPIGPFLTHGCCDFATGCNLIGNLAAVELSERRRDDGAIEISIEGELDLSNASKLREAMFRAFDANGDAGIWVDFARCTFIDSTGLRVIIEGARRAGESSRRLGILNLQEQPRRLFELTSVDRSDLLEIA